MKQDAPVGEEVEFVWPNIQRAVREEQHCWRSRRPVGRGIYAGGKEISGSCFPASSTSAHHHTAELAERNTSWFEKVEANGFDLSVLTAKLLRHHPLCFDWVVAYAAVYSQA